MPAQKGIYLTISRGNADGPPETFTLVGGVRAKSLRIGTTDIDVTTDEDVDGSGVTWGNTLGGRVDASFSGSGVVKSKAVQQALIAQSLAGTPSSFQIQIGNSAVTADDLGVLEGPFKINVEFSGETDGELGFSIEGRSSGVCTWTPTA